MASTASSSGLDPQQQVPQVHRYRDYGGNPLAHVLSETGSVRMPAFGGGLQPGLYKPPPFKFGNPVPLGLGGFALTTFVLSAVNLGVRGLDSPSLVLAPAFAYGGFVQLLAGMWEFALGNVFGATALSSYGGFWISIGIILTPGGFGIQKSYTPGDFYAAFGLYIIGWMIFTFILWLCTLKSTLFFCALFGTTWIALLCLGCGYLDAQNSPDQMPNVALVRAGGAFGMIAGFLAWYNMMAGLLDSSNSFFIVPVIRFPWSEKGREARSVINVAENGESV